MEQKTACPKCQSLSALNFKTKDYNRKTTDQDFCYYKCSGCDLVFLSPIPENLPSHYPPGYHQFPSSLQEAAAWALAEKYKMDIVKKFAQQGRLLDIGPSWGGFAFLAKHEGFQVETIEMDAQCSHFLNNTLKIPTVQSSHIADSLTKMRPYDVVTLWHVIEHFIDPWEVLRAVQASCSKNGLLIIAAPNPQAWQLGLFKERWVHIDAPRHLELIPAQLIIDFLKPLGFHLLVCTTTDEGTLGWNQFGWEYSLSNLTTSSRLKRALSFMGRVACRLCRPFERKALSGSAYTLIFRKEST